MYDFGWYPNANGTSKALCTENGQTSTNKVLELWPAPSENGAGKAKCDGYRRALM